MLEKEGEPRIIGHTVSAYSILYRNMCQNKIIFGHSLANDKTLNHGVCSQLFDFEMI